MYWSKAEEEILKSLWKKPDITAKIIKERHLPHRTINAIQKKASSLGLTKEKIKIDYEKVNEIII